MFIRIESKLGRAVLSALCILLVSGRAPAFPCELARAWVSTDAEFDYANSFGPSLGIELEVSAPATLPLKRIAKTLKEVLALQLQGRRVKINATDEVNILIDYMGEEGPKQWRVELGDFPATSAQRYYGIEIVSPILSSTADLALYKATLPQLINRLGLRAEPDQAGLHVHVQVPEQYLWPLLLLEDVFYRLYPQIQAIWPTSPSRLRYAENRKQLYGALADRVGMIERWFEYGEDLGLDRNSALNLASVLARGTAEFRIFDSTVNIDEITAAVEFARRFVATIISKDPVVMTYLLSHTELSLQKLGSMLGMKLRPGEVELLEQFFEVDKGSMSLSGSTPRVLSRDVVSKAFEIRAILMPLVVWFERQNDLP